MEAAAHSRGGQSSQCSWDTVMNVAVQGRDATVVTSAVSLCAAEGGTGKWLACGEGRAVKRRMGNARGTVAAAMHATDEAMGGCTTSDGVGQRIRHMWQERSDDSSDAAAVVLGKK